MTPDQLQQIIAKMHLPKWEAIMALMTMAESLFATNSYVWLVFLKKIRRTGFANSATTPPHWLTVPVCFASGTTLKPDLPCPLHSKKSKPHSSGWRK